MGKHQGENKVKTSITLDKTVYGIIKNQAKTDSRSLSSFIEIILKRHINETQKGKQKEIK